MCDKDKVSSYFQRMKHVNSPAHARAVLSLANFDEFPKIYNCPVDSRMNPKDYVIDYVILNVLLSEI